MTVVDTVPGALRGAGPAGSHLRTGSELAHVNVGGRTREFPWGQEGALGTAAFWVGQTMKGGSASSYRLGSTLAEEVAACLIGGHGISGEMTLAVFDSVRSRGLLRTDPPPSAEALEVVLREPVLLPGRERPVRYRFAAQRADRLARSLAVLAGGVPDGLAPRELRDWLMRLPGVGPKTASWVVRNLTMSDDIAIVDIHVRRAGIFAGVFDPAWRLPRGYRLFEDAFCQWADLGGVRSADLDVCIWYQLSRLGNDARWLFRVDSLASM